MRAPLGMAAAGALLLSACTGSPPRASDSSVAPTSSSPAASPANDDRPAPDLTDPVIAIVRCEESGATVVTPTVRALPDGITFLIQNRTSRPIQFVPGAIASGTADGESFTLPDGRTFSAGTFNKGRDNTVDPGAEEVEVWTVPPGPAGLVCSMGSVPVAIRSVTEFEVVDPQHLWVEPDLSCDDAMTFELSPFGPDHDPEAFLRDRMLGFRPDDVIGYGEYPQQRYPVAILVRHDLVIGVGRFYSGIPISSVFSVCRDAGITRRD